MLQQKNDQSCFILINVNSDIICFSLSRWDSPISSPSLSLAKTLAKNNRVFYIDHPYSWKDYLKEKKTAGVQSRQKALLKGKNIYRHPPGFPSKLTIVTTPLVYPVNFLPAGKLYNWLSSFNESIVLQSLRTVIRENSIREYVFINFFDPFFFKSIPDDIKPLRFIYQSMDDISQESYTRRHGVKLEKQMIRKADFTLCTSRELTRLKSVLSPNVYYHPNAADTELFQQSLTQRLPRPADMQTISQRVIGFTGSIEYRTDFELLKKIAAYHHDKILFLIGPTPGNEHIKAGLDKMSNVVFAGPRKLEELPAYLQYMDCVIIPYKINTLTKSIYPLKINEYLAAGKPVVATYFSEDIRAFQDVAHIVKTHPEFLRAIDKAIFEDDEEKRKKRAAVAAENSWDKRVEQFWDIVTKDPLKS